MSIRQSFYWNSSSCTVILQNIGVWKMNKKIMHILIALVFIGLFPLATVFTFQASGSHNGTLKPYIVQTGTANYYEDFTSDTYKDPISSAWGWGTGTVTNTRDISFEILDYYATDSPVVDIEVQGRKAYIALFNTTYQPGVAIFNINNLSDIKLQGKQNTILWSETRALDVEGDILVAGQHHSGVLDAVVAHNVEDPFNPAWTWGTGFDNLATDIEIYGHIAFFTRYNDTKNRSLRFFDLEDPFSPSTIYKCDWECDQALGLTVDGGLAYIAASTEGFYILNITNKFDPFEIGYVDTPGNATDVIVDGGFAYLADGQAGVHVIDIRDPTNPAIASTYNTPGYAQKIVKQGRTLYIADGNGKIQVCDVFNPHHISIVFDIPSLPYTYDVALFGGDIIAGTENGVYSIENGYMANFSSSWYPNPFEAPEIWDVRVVDGIAYLAAGEDGVYTVDIRNPLQPTLLDNYNTSGIKIKKIDINGRFLYGIGPSAYLTFDVLDPTNIRLVSALGGGSLTDVDIHGELYYMSFTTGVAILNISDNYNPVVIHSYVAPGVHVNNTAIWAQGTHVYMVEGIDGLLFDEFSCYDFTDFTSPVMCFSQGRAVPMYDVHVDGDLAYLGAGGWLSVYNVSDPTSFTYPDYEITTSWGVWSFGRYVMSAELANGARMYDITDVYDFKLHSNYSGPSSALQITTAGDYTYVANQTSLVVLRHFCSPADTYKSGTSIAQSMKINPDPRRLITEATLNKNDIVPAGTNIEYFMSADGGAHWELVIPGTPHVFTNPGYDLRWRAEISGPRDRSVHLYEVEIDYEFNFAPTAPDLTDPGDTNFLGLIALEWNESTDADGTVDHYEIEVSTDAGFGTIVKVYNTTKLKQSVYPLSPGIYYFRVRAVDDVGTYSDWSIADIEITFNLLGPMWLGIIGGGLIALIIIIVIIAVVVKRKKK